MNRGKVYIILVNYGTPDDTLECLDSLTKSRYTNFRVLIVDIQNINDSVNKINNRILNNGNLKCDLIQEKNNNGFAFANNIAINRVLANNDGEFIWLLNSDTVILDNTLEKLVDCYRENSKTGKIGFVGSKILDYENRKIIQNVGGTFNKWNGYSILTGMGEEDRGQYDKSIPKADYIVGASMFFHISLVSHIGLMPEEYFLYYEDIDWSFAAKNAGFKNMVCPQSVVYHKQGVSTGSKLISKSTFNINKKFLYSGYLMFYKKYFKHFLPVARFILLKQWAGRVRHGNYKEANEILKVLFNK
jgi:GT2 family glycosyltransferase